MVAMQSLKVAPAGLADGSLTAISGRGCGARHNTLQRDPGWTGWLHYRGWHGALVRYQSLATEEGTAKDKAEAAAAQGLRDVECEKVLCLPNEAIELFRTHAAATNAVPAWHLVCSNCLIVHEIT